MPNQSNSQIFAEDQEDQNTNSAQSFEDLSYGTKELLDGLPRVWTRGILYFLIMFAVVVIPWSMLYSVEETGQTVFARLEPKEKTLKQESAGGGTITKILVKEGDLVEKGQVLLELDSNIIDTDIQQLQSQLQDKKNRLNQLEILKNQSGTALVTQQQQNQSQSLEKQAQIDQVQQNLESLKVTYHLQQDEKLKQINQFQQAITTSKSAYTEAKANLLESQEKLNRYDFLLKEGAISKEKFSEIQLLFNVNSERLKQAESNIKQAEERLKEQQVSYDRLKQQLLTDIKQAELRLKEQKQNYASLLNSGKITLIKSEDEVKNLENQMTTIKAEIAQIKSQMEAKNFALSQRVFKANGSGTVFRFHDKGVGAVIQPGELIVEIAPQGSSLILKAQLPTSQSGFLELGKAVKIKFDNYPYQDYNIVNGKLIWKSPTSNITDTPQGKIATFELHIQLEKDCIKTKDKCIPLKAGETATAEVIVNRRRVIDYIIDPFKKLEKGGLQM
jgi:hemolysin D